MIHSICCIGLLILIEHVYKKVEHYSAEIEYKLLSNIY